MKYPNKRYYSIIKVSVIIFLSSFYSLQSFSQQNINIKRHEFNLGHLNLFKMSETKYLGLGYKFHLNKGAIRLYGDYDKSENGHGNINSDDFYSHEIQEFKVRTGYQFQKNIGKIKIFYGSDIYYGVYKETENNVDIFGIFNSEKKEQSFGISPFSGINVYLLEWISLSTETSLKIQLSNIKTHYNDENILFNNKKIIADRKENNVKLLPSATISLNIHF